jgi:hypothetical protein
MLVVKLKGGRDRKRRQTGKCGGRTSFRRAIGHETPKGSKNLAERRVERALPVRATRPGCDTAVEISVRIYRS